MQFFLIPINYLTFIFMKKFKSFKIFLGAINNDDIYRYVKN